MPFNVTSAAAHVRRVVLKFNQEKLELRYNAGEKYREYQIKQQKLDQEYNDLSRRLNAPTPEGEEDRSEEAYKELITAMEKSRRRLADNICTVIEWWDLEGDRDAIKERMSEKDRKRFKDVTGEGEIPIDGAMLDALPLPDEFIIIIRDKIGADFESGGAGGKAR